jgi:hypothetical protein
MINCIKLEYDNLSNTCSVFINEISDNFSASIKSSVHNYKSVQDKNVGLMIAGVNLISHYLNSYEKKSKLEIDLIRFKDNIKRDVTTIKADLERLTLIYKTLNDLYIPKAKIFFKHSHLVLSTELNSLLESIYKNPEINTLKQQRDNLLEEDRNTRKKIIDFQSNIEYYAINTANNDKLLKDQEQQYKNSINSKPKKPFLIFNIISFGSLKRKYNRNIYEWNQINAPFVNQYEALLIDEKLDKEELQRLRIELKKSYLLHEDLNLKLNKLNNQILEKININPEIKIKVLNHLEGLIQILRLAKEIIGLKLDEKLINTVSIDEPTAVTLPDNLKNNIRNFSNSLRENLTLTNEHTIKTIEYVQNNYQNNSYKERSGKIHNQQEISNLTNLQNQAIQKTIDIFETWSKLKEIQEQSNKTHKKYDHEFQLLEADFRENLSALDNKSEILRESLRKINTSGSQTELKNSLLLLKEISGDSLTYADLTNILTGNKIIEI